MFKKLVFFTSLQVLFVSTLIAQQPGDTLIVSAFKYGSTSRDTLLSFPAASPSFEKVI